MNTVIFSAPQGWGKTLKAQQLKREFGCIGVIEEWYPQDEVRRGVLHLTHINPEAFEAPRHAKVVARGWEEWRAVRSR